MASGDSSNRIAISFAADRCLHTRSTWAECSLCVDSCPGEAIRTVERSGLPSVDLSRCMHCGQCLSACPLEAFESSSFTERQLLNRVDPKGPVRLRCFLPYGELEALGSSCRTYQLGTCLGALTSGVLFELSLARACELATDQCERCVVYQRAGRTMKRNVDVASRLLADWSRAANLGETRPLLLSEAPAVGALDGAVPKAADELRPSEEPDDANGVRSSIWSLFHGRRKNVDAAKNLLPLKSKRKHVPVWRQRLQVAWAKRQPVSDGAFLWPALVVDGERCRACGMCMQLCPTGSLRHALDESRFVYSLVPGTCVDCGLCIASCACSALSRDYAVRRQPFEPVECFSQNAEPCARCGMPVLATQGGRLCYLCASEPDSRTMVEKIRLQMKQTAQRTAARRTRRG